MNYCHIELTFAILNVGGAVAENTTPNNKCFILLASEMFTSNMKLFSRLTLYFKQI